MKHSLALGWNILLVLMGTGLLAWIAYNVFVEMQPAAEDKNPVVPTIVGLVLVGTGVARIRRRFGPREEAGDSM